MEFGSIWIGLVVAYHEQHFVYNEPFATMDGEFAAQD
jgi:hypothetical protein